MENKVEKMRDMLNDLDISKRIDEQKVIMLVEERGVISAPFKQVIRQIVDYCTKFEIREGLEIIIPDEICEKFTFIENLCLKIRFNRYENDVENWIGGGSAIITKSSKLTFDKKLYFAIIEINGLFTEWYGVNRILGNTLYNNLCHELHHLMVYWKELLNNKNTISNTHQTIQTERVNCVINNINTSQIFNQNEKDIINQILYRIFNEHESNALIDGLYGDLTTLRSIRSNFKNDLSQTQAYLEYNHYNDIYENFFNSLTDEQINFLYSKMLENSLIGETKVKNAKARRYIILRTIKHHLKQLINKIGSAASFYYDQQEEAEKIMNESETIIMH